MKRIFAVLLLLTLVAPAWAGWDEGVAAYARGDYATAFREMKPLAEQGVARAALNAAHDTHKPIYAREKHADRRYWFLTGPPPTLAATTGRKGLTHAKI